jgi:RND family efflux transporter MFP subunit
VGVVDVERQPIIKEVRVNGSVVALRHAEVSAAVAGRVTQLNVDVGDQVDAGASLVQLDREIAEARLRSARAEADEAQAALEDARRRLREARNLNQNISQSEIRSLEAEVAMDEQALERLRGVADQRRAELERHRVSAPFSGVVSRRMVDPGEWVTPGDGVMEVVNLDQLRLDFQVAQRYLPRLSADTAITAQLDALPGKAFPARVRAIVPVNDPQARTFLLRTEPQDADVALSPGMGASAVLALDTGRESVVVPRDALIRHPDGRTTVWTLEEGDGETRVQESRVETGLTFGGKVEIRSGLETGARVVVEGNEALNPEQEVRISDNGGS